MGARLLVVLVLAALIAAIVFAPHGIRRSVVPAAGAAPPPPPKFCARGACRAGEFWAWKSWRHYRHALVLERRLREMRAQLAQLAQLARTLQAHQAEPEVDWRARQIAAAETIARESSGDPWPNCPDPYDGGGSWDDTAACENGGQWTDSPGYYRCGLQFDPMWERRFGRLCP